MNHRTLKVCCACSLGAGVGSLVALQVNQYFWWIGMLVGGIVGYLSYEYQAAPKAAKTAWRATLGWRPDPIKLRSSFYDTITLSTFAIPAMTLFVIGLQVSDKKVDLSPWLLWLKIVTLNLFLCPVFCYLTVEGPDSFRIRDLEESRKRALEFNPIRVYFWLLPKGVLRGCIWFVSNTRKMGEFLVHLLRLIHCEVRLLCGLDAAVGAGIGYFAGSAIFGVIAGGLLGILHFEIAKRLLRLLGLRPIKSE